MAPTNDGAPYGSELDGFKERLLGGVTRAALKTANAVKQTVKLGRKQFSVTSQIGPKHTAYRRYIRYELVGPLYRQIGVKWKNGECLPLMQKYFRHRFLHATGGWMEYANVPWGVINAGKVR